MPYNRIACRTETFKKQVHDLECHPQWRKQKRRRRTHRQEPARQPGLDPAKIAVERNLQIVPRSTYDQVQVSDGDRYEIVHFIGGGNAPVSVVPEDKPLIIAGKEYKSRLIIGTGKYKTYAENAAALEASGAEMVT